MVLELISPVSLLVQLQKLKIIYEACRRPLWNSTVLEQWFSKGGDFALSSKTLGTYK